MAQTVKVPYCGAMSTSGTANLETVVQQQYSFLGSPDVILNGTLSQTIIDAFLVSQESQTNGTVALHVTMQNESAFKAALRDALLSVTVSADGVDAELTGQYLTAGGSTKSLEQYLVAWARQQIDADLAANTIAAALEASEVINLAITDISQNAFDAAGDMYSGIGLLPAIERDVIASQLPNSRYTVNGTTESFSGTLPLIPGDKMIFRFNVSTVITVTDTPIDLAAGDSNVDGNITPGSAPTQSSGYGIENRVIELVLEKA
jgi:hypothetical protein